MSADKIGIEMGKKKTKEDDYCEVNKGIYVEMSKDSFINACKKRQKGSTGGSIGGKPNMKNNRCKNCKTGEKIAKGRRVFSIPYGIKFLTVAQHKALISMYSNKAKSPSGAEMQHGCH